MSRRYRVRVIVPINTSQYNEEVRQTLAPVTPPDFDVDVANITGGTADIQGRYDLMINSPFVYQLAVESEQAGYDGVFVSDFDMCGVEATREVLNIPIIGGFPPIAFTAMSLADRFSLVTILPAVVAMQGEHPKRYAIWDNLASIRPINIPVKDLTNRVIVREKVYEASMRCIEEDGAQAIILGCTGFIDIARPVQERLAEAGHPAPVIDPNQTSFCFLQLLVRTGQKQSRLTYFPATPIGGNS